jgi:CheY-like chemotaxis protein
MSKVSVLVVDDASFIRDLVKKCLRNYFPGIKIEDAVNGKKAQAMLAEASTWCCATGKCRKCPALNC